MKAVKSHGFTLIEVLVAFAVISIGLLGIEALEASVLGTMTGASGESIIAFEAQSLADAMTANTGYWKAGSFPSGQFTVTGSTISDPTLSANSTNCLTTTCTPVQFAAYDLSQWGTDLQTQVPSATGAISCQLGVTGQPNTCTITINWTPKSSAANQSTQKSASATLSYTLINAL